MTSGKYSGLQPAITALAAMRIGVAAPKRGGIRLGVLDNSKGNADHLLDLIVEGVKKEFKVDSVVIKRKPTSSRPATDQMLDELAQEADLVISAMAD